MVRFVVSESKRVMWYTGYIFMFLCLLKDAMNVLLILYILELYIINRVAI